MIVASKNGNAIARLPVPDADRLVVRATEDPRVFMVKVDSADIVEMTCQCKLAASCLVVPDLDLVVVAGGYKQRLRRMERDSSDRPYRRNIQR